MKPYTPTGFLQSRRTIQDYINWRITRSLPAVSAFAQYGDLRKMNLLEIGCGYGALSYVLAQKAKHVTTTEIDVKKLRVAKQLLKPFNNVTITKSDGSTLSFKNKTFDMVILFDVIEHVDDPKTMLEEVYRVLKPNGIMYVEFTPYYSIVGHHLYDFAKWPIHVLPKSLIKQYVYKKPVKSFLTHDDFWNQFESLNKLRIDAFRSYIRPFIPLKERYIVKYPEKFEFDIPLLAHIGPFKDFFTMSFEGTYQKSEK